MAQAKSDDYHEYYVPHQSQLPAFMALALGTMFVGAAVTISTGSSIGQMMLVVGLGLVLGCMAVWFKQVIEENHAGLPNHDMRRSYVWGMGWFIFSEVLFFATFFGALAYVRFLSVPWLGGDTDEPDKLLGHLLLWPDFQATWPLLQNPDAASFPPPNESMSRPSEFSKWLGWLPLWNTIVLLTSSWTLTIAHHALRDEDRKKLTIWLSITLALAVIFLCLQFLEYAHALGDLKITLESGIYGSTFYLLTGFHGFHVCVGGIMLGVMLWRVIKGHFTPKDHFAFEASAWYWHFVDVVWVGLFLFVYTF